MGPRVRRGAVLPLLLLALWQGASLAGLVDARLLPPPEAVLRTAWRELASGDLVVDLSASLVRDVAGFSGGAVLGLLAGVLLGISRRAERVVLPTFNGFRQIAILAWIPLISLWFGMGDTAKIVFILLSAFTPVALNTFEGVRGAPPALVEVARALGFTPWQRVTRLFLPAALPSVLTGIHLGLIYAWLAAVGAEYFMTAGPGIGGLIIAGRERFEMDLVLFGMILLGAVGFLINLGAAAMERRLLHWSAEHAAAK
jgi:sulfonate transport system permease protein